jgi:hypothetical protein
MLTKDVFAQRAKLVKELPGVLGALEGALFDEEL